MSTDLLKPSEVAERLKVTTRYVYDLIDDGSLEAVRVGSKLWRVYPESVDELLRRGATNASR